MISYGIYIYHMFCIHAVRVVVGKLALPETIYLFPLSLALSAAVAAVSYFAFERWFLDLRQHFRA